MNTTMMKLSKEDYLSKKDYFGQHELCEHEIDKVERSKGIPKRLFMAIGIVESGRSVDKKKGRSPWPWTVCSAGKSYYFTTKSAAVAAVKKMIARGTKNIDVGCMQVNLQHHRNAFRTIEEAFTPKYNVEYAAQFFTSLKDTYGSWTAAVGYYHSKLSQHYKPYCANVYKAWTSAKTFLVRSTHRLQDEANNIRSNITYIPKYYSLVDKKISDRLHKLGRMSLARNAPKFTIKRHL